MFLFNYLEESLDVKFDSCVFFQAYLTEYLQSFSQLPCYAMFTSHHNDAEKQVLKQIGIQA